MGLGLGVAVLTCVGCSATREQTAMIEPSYSFMENLPPDQMAQVSEEQASESAASLAKNTGAKPAENISVSPLRLQWSILK